MRAPVILSFCLSFFSFHYLVKSSIDVSELYVIDVSKLYVVPKFLGSMSYSVQKNRLELTVCLRFELVFFTTNPEFFLNPLSDLNRGFDLQTPDFAEATPAQVVGRCEKQKG